MCVYQKCKSKIPKSDHIKVWTQKRLQGIHTPVTNCWRTNSIVIPSTFPPEDLLWAGFKGVLSLLSLLFVFSSDHWDKKNKQTPTHCPISVDEPLILWDWRLRFHSPFKSLALLWAWLQVLSKPYITPLPVWVRVFSSNQRTRKIRMEGLSSIHIGGMEGKVEPFPLRDLMLHFPPKVRPFCV